MPVLTRPGFDGLIAAITSGHLLLLPALINPPPSRYLTLTGLKVLGVLQRPW
jgi:hypothetical protein